MKKFMILALAALNLSVTASAYAQWETVLDCDNGAAILQVNADERRNFQFVVKEPSIITYFLGTGAFRNAGTNFGNGRELVIGGWAQRGVFSPYDFDRADGGYNYGDSFLLERQNYGMKLMLRNINNWSTCDGDVSPSTGMCNGNTRSGVNIQEYANWYFQDCR